MTQRWRLARLFSKRPTVEEMVGSQLKATMREGVNGPFQAGYVCALYWTWEQAALPDTAETIAARALVESHILDGQQAGL